MFTGIIESIQQITQIEIKDQSIQISVFKPEVFDDVKAGDSIAMDGVCLTVESCEKNLVFTLGLETLKVLRWTKEKLLGKTVNLERSLRFGDRIHGHFVSGHADGLTPLLRREVAGDCIILEFQIPPLFRNYFWPKGSIALNGVSLTINTVSSDFFSVCLIPETLKKTNLEKLQVGDVVSFECDHFIKGEAAAATFTKSGFDAIQDIIADFQKGRMVILVDDEDRENEGDIIIAADFITPEAINFMSKNARGLICLALHPDQVARLQLPQMVSEENNSSPNKTAFTVSIEAAHGVSTGISAWDRAHTVSVASNPKSTPADILMPGHIFPIRAHKNGVLSRNGHTEAGVDLAILAGLNPAAVICEVINEDGTMARVPNLFKFAQRFGIKVGTIKDLENYLKFHQKSNG